MASGQELSASKLLDITNESGGKFDTYLYRRGFSFATTSYQGDTVSREYITHKKRKTPDSLYIKRVITSFVTKEDFSFNYQTTSPTEYESIKAGLKDKGFFCNREADSLMATGVLYQHNQYTVWISAKSVDTLTEYSFKVRKQELPRLSDISVAEDLSVFNSHEYLRYFFGTENVRKDIYYFSEKAIGKCSILFPGSNKQVVFIWGDDANDFKLEKIYIGGQLMAESSIKFDENVAENIWHLKSGIHPGMSLYLLRKLNEASFSFYGGNSAQTGMILPDNNGKLNFKDESVILGCVNCKDPEFLKKPVITSDDAIQEERILFVQTIILEPLRNIQTKKASRR
jgi:hypothetical protein